MLPLHIPALSPGALHSLFQLVGTEHCLSLWPFIIVTLYCLIQRLVFYHCSGLSWVLVLASHKASQSQAGQTREHNKESESLDVVEERKMVSSFLCTCTCVVCIYVCVTRVVPVKIFLTFTFSQYYMYVLYSTVCTQATI